MSRLRNKLSVKQLANLSDVGVHSDGGGLYLRVRQAVSGVTRSWVSFPMSAASVVNMAWGLRWMCRLAKRVRVRLNCVSHFQTDMCRPDDARLRKSSTRTLWCLVHSPKSLSTASRMASATRSIARSGVQAYGPMLRQFGRCVSLTSTQTMSATS